MNHDAKTRLLALLMILCLILTNSLTSVYANNNTSENLNSEISPKTTTTDWDYKSCQTPEYFMQILAKTMSLATLGKMISVVKYNVATKYEPAKRAIVKSALGLEHPHYTESYYVLSKNIASGDYR